MRFLKNIFHRRSRLDRLMNAFRPKKHTPLRVKLLAVFAIASLLVSGLTFAVGWVGAAITWPSTPAWEASGGTIMSYFRNAFGDASTQTQKICTNSGVIRWFRVDGTPVCASLSDLSGTLPTPSQPLSFSFSASSTSITSWASTTLTWSTTNAISCMGSNGWSGSKAIWSKTETVSPTTTTTYRLICTWSNWSPVSQDVTVNVANPIAPTILFVASSTSISPGASTTLTWSTTNAISCTASNGWSWDKSINGGNQSVIPTNSATTTYTLTCNGQSGTSDTKSVSVMAIAPVEILFFEIRWNFNSNSDYIYANDIYSVNQRISPTFQWNANNATGCDIAIGSSKPSHLQNLSTKSSVGINLNLFPTTYTLTCSNESWSSSISIDAQ